MLKQSREFLAKIREELDEEQAAHQIIREPGITLTYDYDTNELGYVPGSDAKQDHQTFPIEFPEDDWTMPTDELLKLVMYKIENGLDEFLPIIIARKSRIESGRRGASISNEKKFKGKSKKEIKKMMSDVRHGKKKTD